MTRTTSFKASARKTALCIAAAIGLAASVAPAAAQECNPLTLLFGGCQQARVAPALPAYEPMNVAPHVQVHAKASLARAKKPIAPARRHKVVASKLAEAQKSVVHRPGADAPVGSLARFAADPTLRAGDIVVTSEGFRVFRNNRFTPIAQDGGALAKLEQASMRQHTAAIVEVEKTPAEKRGLVALRRAIRVASSQ